MSFSSLTAEVLTKDNRMLKAVLIARAIAASSAMAAENDEDYKAEAAIRGCASVVRTQGYP
jgi:hypothetical protein